MLKSLNVLIVAMLLLPAAAMADVEKPTGHRNVINEIIEGSEGNISIEIPDEVQAELDYYVAPTKTVKKNTTHHSNPNPNHTSNVPVKKPVEKKKVEVVSNQGYRIQVFGDGTDKHTLKARATKRAGEVVSRFPRFAGQVYTFSRAPKWYCEVGNFRSRAEADQACSQLRKAFPQFAGEIRVVSTRIQLR